MRNRFSLLLIALLFISFSAHAQAASVSLCGTLNAYVQATATTAGSITINGQRLDIAAGTIVANSNLLVVGSSVCVQAQLNAGGLLSSPMSVQANVSAVVNSCGTVAAFARPTATAAGLLTIGNQTYPIAAGTSITNSDLIVVGANLCLRATLNGLGQITAPSTVALNATSTVEVCGIVSAVTHATASQAGSLLIDGRLFTIAAGTSIANANLMTAGANICLKATLNAFGEIVAPSSVTAGASAVLELCGVVSAYTAATAAAPGFITIGNTRREIAAGTTISGEGLIHVGASICLKAKLDANGRVSVPASVTADVSGMIEVCGVISAFQAATANAPGAITIDGQRFTIAINTTISGQESISVGANLCLKATINVKREIVPPTTILPNRPPQLTVPGPQTVQVGSRLTFTVTARDPDATDSVTLSARNLPQNSEFTPASGNPATGVFTFAPAPSQVSQTFTVTFRATDSRGASVTGNVDIRVTAAPPGGGNRPPQLQLPGPQNVAVGTTLTFNVSANDPDDENVQINVRDLPNGATANPSPANGNPAVVTVRFTPTESQRNQTFVVTFIATDPNGATDSGTVPIRVGPTNQPGNTPPTTPTPPTCVNRPPIVSAPRSLVIELGQVLRFRVVAVDPEGDGIHLSSGELPPGFIFDSVRGEITFTPGESSCEAVGQPMTIVITARDSRGATTTVPIRVLVTGRFDNGSNPPVVSAPVSPVIVRAGERIEFALVGASQENGCPLTIAPQTLANASYDASNGRFSFTASASLAGKVANAVFTARDCRGNVTTTSVPIIVANGAEGRLALGVNRVVFDPVEAASNGGFVTVPITNHGLGWLRIDSATLSQGIDFQLDGAGSLPVLLPPGGSIDLQVVYQPRRNGASSDVLMIRTSDPARSSIAVNIDATASVRRRATAP